MMSLQNSDSLKQMTDPQLLGGFEKRVAIEKENLAELVEFLKEIDLRRIYLGMGYSSLFVFLTLKYKYTGSSAQRRIDAARFAQSIPSIVEDLSNGALNLMQISLVARGVRQKRKVGVKVSVVEIKELLESLRSLDLETSETVVAQTLNLEVQRKECSNLQKDGSLRIAYSLTKVQQGKICRARELLSNKHGILKWAELMTVLAEEHIKHKDPRVPRRKYRRGSASNGTSDVRDTDNVKAPDIVQTGNNVRAQEKGEGQEKGEAQDKGRAQENVNTDDRIEADLRIKDGVGFQNKNVEESQLTFEEFAQPSQQQAFASAKQGLNRSASESHVSTKSHCQMAVAPGYLQIPKQRRAIPAGDKRALHERHHGCQFVDQTSGRRCDSKLQLQIEHIQPIWAGGDNALTNLTLLCANHNRWKYRMGSGLRSL